MQSTPPLNVGDHIPNFNLKSIEGVNFSISEIIGKRNLILHFFTNNKTHLCKEDTNSFSYFESRMNLTNAQFVAISNNFTTSSQMPTETFKKLGKNFSLLNDEKDELSAFFGLALSSESANNSITFVVDRFGKIKAKFENIESISNLMDQTLKALSKLK